MKLSTKGQYGARAMLELAIHYENGPILLRDIAKKQGLSERYLERIMTVLISAGLVRSLRGKCGGFILTKPLEEIKLSQIVQATEGSLSPVVCLDDPASCKRIKFCVTYDIWGKLKKEMMKVLDSITLADMVQMQKKKVKETEEKMYYI
ncbi:MAG: Rrf2 family transcriptional regulator [bacterium]